MHDLLFWYARVHGPAAFEGIVTESADEVDE